MNNSNKALKAGFWYTVSNFLVKGIAFISMPFFTRLMTQNDIGIFSNIISWFNVLAIITTFEIYSSINIARFDYKKDLDSYISSSLFLSTLITAIFYILFLIFNGLVTKFLMIDFNTLNVMFIYLLVYPAVQMFQTRKQILYDYKSIMIVSLLSAFLSTLCSLVLVIILQDKLFGRVYGYFIPLIVISIVVYVYLLKQGKINSKKAVSRKYWKYAIVISFPLIWHLLAGYLLNAADKIMITKLISPSANALYSVSYSIAALVSILWMSLNNAWSPWAYEKMEGKDYRSLKNCSKPYTILFLTIVCGVMLFGPELLLIMGGSKYAEAVYVLPPVMVGYVFQFVYSLYVNIEFYHKKQRNIAIGTIITCIINIVLNFIFIPAFGYIAAAYTTLASYIVSFFIHYFLVRRLKCSHWYDSFFFAKILSLSLVLVCIFNLLYLFDIIRYMIIVLFAIAFIVFFIMKHNQIISLIKHRDVSSILQKFEKEAK